MKRISQQLLIVFLCAAGMAADVAAQSERAERERAERGGRRERELETDRDAFTPYGSTVGARTFVYESSYSFIDNRTVAETHSFPESLLRYGIGERIELRLGWNYEVGGAGDVVSGNEAGEGGEGGLERETQLLYGFKTTLIEQRGWLPRSAVIVQGYTPTSGEAPATDFSLGYTGGWALSEKLRLDGSLRYGTEHAAHDAFNLWAPSVVLRATITERWHAHVEYFGIYSDGAPSEFSRALFSPGANYLLTENLELGARVGWGLTDDAPNFFSNVGVGWRF